MFRILSVALPAAKAEGSGRYGPERCRQNPIELSRTVRLWVLNIFLTFRAGVTNGGWRQEEWQMRWPGGRTASGGMIESGAFNAENR
jgi:hypothetical protein